LVVFQISDNGRYYCNVLEGSHEVLDKCSVDLYVYETVGEYALGWSGIIEQVAPVKELLLDVDGNESWAKTVS
uniref:BT3A1 protein n=1 Tax=Gongylonema pulchrum TaxID=637853 RepID=A0A183D4J5_9BILA